MIIRNKYQVNCLIKENDNLIIFGDKKCSISNKKKDYVIPGNALGGFKINEGVLYFTEEIVYLFDFTGKPKKICEKNSLDFVTVFNNNLIIVNNESFFIYSIKDNYNCQNFPATHRGVCVGSVIWNNRLYLGYENGSICFLEESNISNKDTSNKDTSNKDTSNKDTSNKDTSNKDTSNEDTSNEDTSNKDTSNSSISVSEIIKMDESISSFDIFNDLICIAFFDKKIAVCDSKGNNFKYTEIKFNPKIIKFWKMHILCLDGENNLFLLDINLKILYCENFENNLISFDIIDDLMYQIYKDGTIIIQENIKEYIN